MACALSSSDGARADEATRVRVLRGEVSLRRPHDDIQLLVLDHADEPGDLDAVDIVIAPPGAVARHRREVVTVDDPELAVQRITAAVASQPVAAWALARLLPVTAAVGASEGLVAESATFSMLLAGGEFHAWLADRGRAPAVDDGARVAIDREGDILTVTLNRPHRRNAYDAAMRDQLLEALEIARLDPRVEVVICGSGPDFCSGGDLDEFGTVRDVAVAHRVRVMASAGRCIDQMRQRVSARVHGNVVGSGIEIAAFAGVVTAAPMTRFWLPELSMGLIPGAGGTVSLTRRIGRHRLLWWALSGTVIDTATAIEWGLADDVHP